MATAWSRAVNVGPDDVNYCVLPLYHTAAGILGVGTALSRGTTVVVRRKFSASRFWDECILYKATVSTMKQANSKHGRSALDEVSGPVEAPEIPLRRG